MQPRRASKAMHPEHYLQVVFIFVMVIFQNPAWAEGSTQEDMLNKISSTEALETLVVCHQSEMMTLLAQLIEAGVNVVGPDGPIAEQDEAQDLLVHHRQVVEVCEEVLAKRGAQDIAGQYDFEVQGRCPSSWDWSLAQLHEACDGAEIRQDATGVTIVFSCTVESETSKLEYTGKTMEDAILIEDFMNSDILYPGRIGNGIIRFLIAANPAKTKWPSFDKPLSRKAKKRCWVTMSPAGD